jgi:hypothetical protein
MVLLSDLQTGCFPDPIRGDKIKKRSRQKYAGFLIIIAQKIDLSNSLT